MERLTYTVTEVAEALGISRSKAYTLVAEGAIAVVPLPGRRKLVARATLDRLLDGPPSPANQHPQPNTNHQPKPKEPNPDTKQPDATTNPRTHRQPTHPDTNTYPPISTHTVAPGVRGSSRTGRSR
jgi:excisionase family DNA binding protein